VHELDVVDQAYLVEQDGTYEAIEIAARDKAVFLVGHEGLHCGVGEKPILFAPVPPPGTRWLALACAACPSCEIAQHRHGLRTFRRLRASRWIFGSFDGGGYTVPPPAREPVTTAKRPERSDVAST
jgi:hypothetical protein